MPLTRNQSNAAAQAKLVVDNSETSTSKESGDQGGAAAESEPPRRDSPENCSICLGPFNNKSFTSSCAHSFCFVCLKQWSKVKAECPLCKQPFTSIFHNIRSNQHYDIYELPHQPSNQMDYNIFNYVGAAIPSFTGPTHHHLFSLSQPAFDADLTLSNFSRFQFRHRRYDRYLNPLVHGEHQYSFSGPAVNPSSHISAATWPRGTEEFRREVYRRNIGPPAVILGCENSNYRLTPAMVSASAHRLHRIMPWLTRELRVLLRNHQNVRLALSVIQPLLTQVTIDSMYFYDKILPLIGHHRSRQFVQEFVAFANSALSMQAYDRKAMYRRREAAPAVPSSSSSPSSENDVVEVTDISPDIHPATSAPGPSQTQPLNLSRSGWDSPTPGPSWSNSNVPIVSSQASVVDRVSVSSESDDPVFRPDINNSESEDSKPGSDIIFVKYDKPWNERSPIRLTSDSDGGGETGTEPPRKKKKLKHKKKKREPTDDVAASTSKKDKSKKSSKSKHRDKSKASSKAMSDEDRDPAVRSKRQHSQSSTEQHKIKKHKKSKSKREKLTDREVVDRYFAQAMVDQEKDGNASKTEEKEEDVSAKRKGKEKHGASSSKDRARKKKKNRKHSKDSHNQSYQQTCKKHHSGHKKTSNRLTLTDAVPVPETGRAYHRRSPIRANQAGGSNRIDVVGNDIQGQHEASGSGSMSHPVVPGFQPPYLSMTDTVQHIPVNLWVSAWPTLSVSHTYPPPPPPPIPMEQSILQDSNTSSSLRSNPGGAGQSRHGLDRLSISSDSSSDSSDSESDDAQDLQIPSLQNVHSRTKQWLEANFPDLGRPQSSSASVPAGGSTSSSTVENPSTSVAKVKPSEDGLSSQTYPEGSQILLEPETTSKEKQKDVEIVSIPSGDEDVVICSSSSDDSCSNVEDLWVTCVDKSNKNKDKQKNISSATNHPSTSKKEDTTGVGNISTLPFSGDISKPLSSGPCNIILPPVNKSFQPFKLQKKPAMSSRGKDPFFPFMTHSSDEDGEVDTILHSASTTTCAENTKSHDNDCSIAPLSKPELAYTDNLEDIATSVLPSVASLPTTHEGTETSSHGNIFQAPGSHATMSSSSLTSASFSSETSSVFSLLPPLLSSSSTTTALSSGIKYLPYSNLTPPTSMSSLLPCYIPPSSLPLSLSFPFPQIPPLLTSSVPRNPMLSSLYQPQTSNQTETLANASAVSGVQNLINERGESGQMLPRAEPDEINKINGEVRNESHSIGTCSMGEKNSLILTNKDIGVSDNSFTLSSLLDMKNGAVTCTSGQVQNVEQCVLGNDSISKSSVDSRTSVVHALENNSMLSTNNICQTAEMTLESSTDNDNNIFLPSESSITNGIGLATTGHAFQSDISASTINNPTTGVASDVSFSWQDIRDKPFDILESLSVEVPSEKTYVATSEFNTSNSTPTGTSIVTTVADRFQQSVILNSAPVDSSLHQSSFQSSMHPFFSQSSEMESRVYKPNIDYVNSTVHQFKDALASSGSGSDTDE